MIRAGEAAADGEVRSLYIRGDPYETSDAVFGVKSSLIVDLKKVDDEQVKDRYGVDETWSELVYDFVLVGDEEAKQLRVKNALDTLKKQGRTARLVDGLPVADLD